MIRDVPDETQHVPEGPDATRIVPDGPDATRVVADGPLAATPAPGLPRFGRFQTTAQLGAGAMGTVYRAHDDVLGRDVAIKALHAKGELGVRERFIREARAIGAVHHPHILAIHDAGDEDGTPYLVMELAAGGSLREQVKAGPMPVDTVREIGIQIARALAAAHAANIIHRDVKPANILLAQPGTWKLADFGIARMPDSTLTIEGQFLGSPSYAAPESLRAGQFSAASDVYSLGATLYEALAGTPPHGDHDMQSLVRKLEADPVPLHTRRPVPGPLGDAIMAALARDPAQRPTADELAQCLARTDHHPVPVGVTPAPPVVAAASTSRTLKLLAGGLAALAVIAIVFAAKSRSDAPGVMPAVPRTIENLRAPEMPAGDEFLGDGELGEFEPPGPPGAPEESDELAADDAEELPLVVDQYGNPVDEETARAILEEMERDARSSFEAYERGPKHKRGRGHGKGKKRRGRDD